LGNTYRPISVGNTYGSVSVGNIYESMFVDNTFELKSVDNIYRYRSVGNNPWVMLNLPTDTDPWVNWFFLVVEVDTTSLELELT